MPVNCARCASTIPAADISARKVAKDAKGNFYCAACAAKMVAAQGAKPGGAMPAPKGGIASPSGPAPKGGVPAEASAKAGAASPSGPAPKGGLPAGASAKAAAVPPPGTAPRPAAPPAPRPGAARPAPRGAGGAPPRGPFARGGPRRSLRARDAEEEAGEEAAPPPRRGAPNKSKWMAVIGGVVALGAGAGFVINLTSTESARRELEDRQRVAEDAMQEIDKYQAKHPFDFPKLRALAQAAIEKSKGLSRYEGPAKEKLAAFEAGIERGKKEKRATTQLDDLEKDADDPAKAASALQKLKEIQESLDMGDPAIHKRFQQAAQKAAARRIEALLKDVEAAEAQDAKNYDAILAKLDAAWDAVLELQPPPADALRKILDDADRLTHFKYQGDAEAKEPWIDLLGGEWAGQWKAKAREKIQFQFSGGELAVEGLERGDYGILYIGLDKRWADLVVEAEFAIESKGFRFLGRYGRSQQIIEYPIEAGLTTAWKEGESYKMTVSVKGMEVRAFVSSDKERTQPVGPLVAPSGGLAVAVAGGGKVKFKSFKLKVLRTQAGGGDGGKKGNK